MFKKDDKDDSEQTLSSPFLSEVKGPSEAAQPHLSVDMHDVCKHLRGNKNHLGYNRSQDLPGQEDGDASSPGVP